MLSELTPGGALMQGHSQQQLHRKLTVSGGGGGVGRRVGARCACARSHFCFIKLHVFPYKSETYHCCNQR